MQVRTWTLIMVLAAATLQDAQAAAAAAVCSVPERRANLDFTLPDIAGRQVALRRFRGDVVLINFWATWCAPCRVEIPDLLELYDKYHKRGLVILGVSVDDATTGLAAFAARLRITYPVLIGAQQQDFQDAFGPPAGFPTSVLIARDGKICRQYVGRADPADLERRVRALLATNTPGSIGPDP